MKEKDHVDRFFRNPEWERTPVNEFRVKTVNRRIDQFAHFPNSDMLRNHRKYLHHAEGIAYFKRLFGEIGEAAARQHVMEDCEWIPQAIDYYNGNTDEYGHYVGAADEMS